MGRATPKDLCNVALVGHNDSGKTTLAEAILHLAKATKQRGSVADGTSVLDAEPEERERKTSIDLGMAFFPWAGREFTLFDAPGMFDFCGEAISALTAAETALVCVNAASGVMVNTRKMWKAAGDLDRARAVVVNKLDLDNIDLPAVVRTIRETFGAPCVPVNLPVGLGGSVERVVNVLSQEVPGELSEIAHEAREKLMEMDDKLLEKYLEGKDVKPEELAPVLPGAVASGKLCPILFTAALKDVGVKELLDFLAAVLPSPDVHWKQHPGGEGWPETAGSADGPFIARIFRSIYDPFVGRVAFGKVVSGRLTPDKQLYNNRTETASRMGGLFRPFGKDTKAAPEVVAGDIFAVTKVDDLLTQDTVTNPGTTAKFQPVKYPVPMVSLAAEPKSREHEQRLTTALGRMSDGDPTLRISRDPQTAELVITGMSQFQIEVMLERTKRRYQVEVVTKMPKIPLKETVQVAANGHHRHKKQTGGRGQFGEVYIKLEPAERGKGFEFVDEISQGRIPQQFIPPVEKGIREAAEKGVYAGYPVVDFRVRLVDGSYHDVDSGPESFKIAGSKAFKKAFAEAKPGLLEPVVNLEVVVPAKFMGDVTGHLNQHRGRIMGIESDGPSQVIRAVIPLMEVMQYSAELRSMTGGEGSYTMEFSHYDVLPHRLAEAIVARTQKKEEEDED